MRRIFYIIIAITTLTACKKTKKQIVEDKKPTSAALVTPASNSVCFSGQVVSSTTTSVTFNWQAANNTDSYELVLTNLFSKAVTRKATTENKLILELDRQTPYAWYVISKSNTSSETPQSDTWKFYTAGEGQVSYAPFAAGQLSPSMDQTVSASGGKVTLTWVGEDVDGDISGYDIYLGNNRNALAPIKENHNATSLEVVLASGQTYYWKVITKDQKSNTSTTAIYQFKTQ
ncbi:hypothetical protein BCY91_03050 [Pelobium manganitolerans]|uniref:Fibronectin type-III domain-containing protein n=1 Tax=Pelobium manganitolerans TaxID=1842495 RepID=A0A419S7J5_9SPHI|nr:hypothetical protein [Pelobium manganitolerans]RKD17136.1 hypothetical protein BCY91_03050 [Pelobium manganitolerans]